jgi:hypothetical protein
MAKCPKKCVISRTLSTREMILDKKDNIGIDLKQLKKLSNALDTVGLVSLSADISSVVISIEEELKDIERIIKESKNL